MSGWACSVVWTVWGESVMGASVDVSRGGSGTGPSFGDSLEALYEATEDIWAQGRVRGGVERIVSCCCWQ
jgi:hypothetical protein